MRVSVFGPRKITEDQATKVVAEIDTYISDLGYDQPTPLVFLTGGASGVQDVVYEEFSQDYDFIVFKPWTQISKRLEKQALEGGSFDPVYFFFRNLQIIDNSDVVIVFDSGQKDAEVYKVLEVCQRKNKKVYKVEI